MAAHTAQGASRCPTSTAAAAAAQLSTSREEIQTPKHSGEASSSPYWKSWRAAMEAVIHENLKNLKLGVGVG